MDNTLYVYMELNNIADRNIDIVIAGSSSLILNNVINVVKTEDIDIMKTTKQIPDELLAEYDMNMRVSCMETFLPYNYQDRLVKLDIETKVISYYLLSVEDSVIGKIQANRIKDINHLNTDSLKENINWNKLKECALEMKDSLFNKEQYKWFLARYNDYVESNGHKEVIIQNI